MKSRRERKGPTRRTPSRRIPAVEERTEAAPVTAVPSGGGPVLSGGDVDADWTRAESTGEETVGGSVATPDQDVVDEIGRALGVEQEPTAEVVASEDILRRRDRFRWHLERDADVRERETEEQREQGVLGPRLPVPPAGPARRRR
jgi:hypothetical protein